jgi:hypothetical protein
VLKEAVLKAVESAKVALSDLAVPAVLRSIGEISYIPGVPVSPDTTNHAVTAVVTSYDVKEIDGDRIQASDVKGILFPEVDVPTPKLGDFLDVGTTSYRVMNCDHVYAGDSVALSQLHLRPS